MNYITVDQFKTNYPSVDLTSYTDATVSGLITNASNKVDSFLEHSILAEDISDEITEGHIDTHGNIVIFPRKTPINSISTLSIVKGTEEISITLTSGGTPIYDIPSSKDRIYIGESEITYQSVTVINWGALRTTNFWVKLSYNAGYEYSEIPSDIKEATELYLLEFLARTMNLSGARAIRQGGISIEYSGRKGRSDLVQDAENLLFGYKRVSGI